MVVPYTVSKEMYFYGTFSTSSWLALKLQIGLFPLLLSLDVFSLFFFLGTKSSIIIMKSFSSILGIKADIPSLELKESLSLNSDTVVIGLTSLLCLTFSFSQPLSENESYLVRISKDPGTV